ncbi:MAG TPA: hypothetical protein VKU41_02220 [Polyangiaceae bacterium]|nr:hypothetical protein [Polyangiaceae bacterium]
MSRAEWFAMGSAVVLGGCSGRVVPPDPQPNTVSSIAFRDFGCGDAQCVANAEFCYNDRDFNACVSYLEAGVASDDGACSGRPTCACYEETGAYQGAYDSGQICSCTDDDAGGLTVSACTHSHSCYGSPPARLDRRTLAGNRVVDVLA